MGLERVERNQIANALYNYVERAYANNQSRREVLDHLITTYREKGQEAIDDLDWTLFRELLDEAL